MWKLIALIAVLLSLMTALAHAQDKPDPAPLEVGTKVELTLAKPYLTAEGARVSTTWREIAGKRLLTVTASGQGPTMIQAVEGARLEGMVTAVDDEWLTLDLGEQRPLLRVPRGAILRWGSPALPAQKTEPPEPEQAEPEGEPYPVSFGVGERVEIALTKPYLTAEGVRVRTTWTERAGKPLMTLSARGRARTMTQPTEEGHVRGLLTAVDDAWLTVNLGREQPFLRIPRRTNVIIHVQPWFGLFAQDETPASSANDIRLVSTDLGPRPLTGSLLDSDNETLLVRVSGRTEPVRVRRSSVERVEVFRGRQSSAGGGAIVGGLTLGVIGGMLFTPIGEFPGSDPDKGALKDFGAGFAWSAPVGALLGAVIGSALTTEVWERVPLSVAVTPGRRSARAALTLRF
jgi:hypothetical protein